jgi:hypothetical protein
MPTKIKRTFRRKFKRRFKRRGKKAKKAKLFSMPLSKSLNPFPSRYRAHFVCQMSGYVAAASPTGATFNVFAVGLQPFNATSQFPNMLSDPIGSPVITTLQPAGFSNICSNTAPYNRYRVLSSKVSVQWQPQAVSDCQLLLICATPVLLIPITGGGGFANAYAGMTNAEQGPYSKNKIVQSNNLNFISLNVGSHARFFGMTEKDYCADIEFVAPYNQRPQSYIRYDVKYNLLDGNPLSSPCIYKVRLSMYIEFESQIGPDLLDV